MLGFRKQETEKEKFLAVKTATTQNKVRGR